MRAEDNPSDIENIIRKIKTSKNQDKQFIQNALSDKSLFDFIKIKIDTSRCVAYLFYKKKFKVQRICELLNLSLTTVKGDIKKWNPNKRSFPSRLESKKRVDQLKQFALEHPDYTISKIARELKMSVSLVGYHVKKEKISVYKDVRVYTQKNPITKEQKNKVMKLYKQFYTVKEISDEIGLNDKSVRRILNKNKLPILPEKRLKTDRLVLSTFKRIKSIKETAEKTGENEYAVQQILKRHNIDYKASFEKKVIAVYKRQNKSIRWTAHYLSTSELAVREILYKHSIIL
jgi:AraC-like DNA-binding protein